MKPIIAVMLVAGILIAGCVNIAEHTRQVYLLIDPTDTAFSSPNITRDIVYALLAALRPNDTLAVAHIDSDPFSETDRLTRVTFGQRPSVANHQKRALAKTVAEKMTGKADQAKTDIIGGFEYAASELHNARAKRKIILICADLSDDIAKLLNRQQALKLDGFEIVAVNAFPQNGHNERGQAYEKRADQWRKHIENSGGRWRMVNNLDHLKRFIEASFH